jgi:hypothetical protein
MKPLGVNAHIIEEFLHQSKPTPGIIIAFHIMAIPRVATGNQDAIGTLL